MIDPAAIRPDEWGLPLFLHVLGAFTLIGALVMAATYLFAARRDGSLELTRLGYRSLLFAALPALIVMRVAAQWLEDEEGLAEADLTWTAVGYMSSDLGLLLLIGSTVATGLAVRRAGSGQGAGGGRGVAVAAWLVSALIAVYAVVIWLMATKPD